MDAREYLRRCRQLHERGLSQELWRLLREAGSIDLLRAFERYDDAGLVKLSRLHRERSA